MRLLHTTRLELHEFIGDDTPIYAILSHTWGDGEVSFQDLREGKGPNKAGYPKIEGCCTQARRDGYDYVWIDTCCIDKSSSSELSEAINSMFRWYRNSLVCYAYLSDVPGGETIVGHHASESAFRKSRWFTRGWTLQELIAPESVIFFDCDWIEIGTRSYLRNLVSAITLIEDVGGLKIDQVCVAQKMSWASRRSTTRLEDEAYCLMGIFGVNMPLLYGEGAKAFTRLQEEILKVSTDESLFAWETLNRDGKYEPVYGQGMLASHPYRFRNAHTIRMKEFDEDRLHYSMTNKGLSIDFPVYQDYGRIKMPLNCYDLEAGRRLVLILTFCYPKLWKRVDVPTEPGIQKLSLEDLEGKKLENEHFYVSNEPPNRDLYKPKCLFQAKLHEVLKSGFTVHNIRGQEINGDEIQLTLNAYAWIPWSRYRDSLSLVCRHNNGDCFVVDVQNMWEKRPLSFGSKIHILEDYQPGKNISDSLPDWSFENGRDRASKLLPSGKGVTVTMSKKGDCAELEYLVNITINLDGKLPWPELEED